MRAWAFGTSQSSSRQAKFGMCLQSPLLLCTVQSPEFQRRREAKPAAAEGSPPRGLQLRIRKERRIGRAIRQSSRALGVYSSLRAGGGSAREGLAKAQTLLSEERPPGKGTARRPRLSPRAPRGCCHPRRGPWHRGQPALLLGEQEQSGAGNRAKRRRALLKAEFRRLAPRSGAGLLLWRRCL